MRKTREEKAITLIALIITIVVLLILAVVAINAVTGDGIIQHAVNAKEEHEKAQVKENGILAYYEQYINTQNGSGPWKQDGNTIYMVDSNGQKVEIEIGDKVKYIPTQVKNYTSKAEITGAEDDQLFVVKNNDTSWKVLGEENGKILLVACDLKVPIIDDVEQEEYVFTGLRKPNKVVEELNDICSIYGDGKGAEYSRSINLGDILELCKVTQEEINSSGTNEYVTYGAKYNYMYDNEDKIICKKNNIEMKMNIEEILFQNGEKINSANKGPKEIISNHFVMDLHSKENSEIILLDEPYWVASDTIHVYEKSSGQYIQGDFVYGVNCIANNSGERADIGSCKLFDSDSTTGYTIDNIDLKILPVVVLKSDAKFKTTTDNQGNLIYEIEQ